MLEQLIEQGAEFKQEYPNVLTPFFWACAFGQVECVDLMLKHGADANERYGDGDTILIFVVKSTNLEVTVRKQPVPLVRFLRVIELLIAKGADASYRNLSNPLSRDGYSALDCAKRPEVAALLSCAHNRL